MTFMASALCCALWVVTVWAWCYPERVGKWLAQMQKGYRDERNKP